jgi:hypothetical protein
VLLPSLPPYRNTHTIARYGAACAWTYRVIDASAGTTALAPIARNIDVGCTFIASPGTGTT